MIPVRHASFEQAEHCRRLAVFASLLGRYEAALTADTD